jgi:hypothetical protein
MIAERIAESGLTPEEWWQQAREVLGSDARARPLSARSSAYLTPQDRAWMSAELVELVLDGIEARYGI